MLLWPGFHSGPRNTNGDTVEAYSAPSWDVLAQLGSNFLTEKGREDKNGREGKEWGGDRDWPQNGGLSLPSLKCGCSRHHWLHAWCKHCFKVVTVCMQVHVCLHVGSLEAAVLLMQKLNAIVLQCVVVVELLSLNGRSNVSADVFALISQWIALCRFLFKCINCNLNTVIMYIISVSHATAKWQYTCKYGLWTFWSVKVFVPSVTSFTYRAVILNCTVWLWCGGLWFLLSCACILRIFVCTLCAAVVLSMSVQCSPHHWPDYF